MAVGHTSSFLFFRPQRVKVGVLSLGREARLMQLHWPHSATPWSWCPWGTSALLEARYCVFSLLFLQINTDLLRPGALLFDSGASYTCLFPRWHFSAFQPGLHLLCSVLGHNLTTLWSYSILFIIILEVFLYSLCYNFSVSLQIK